MMRTALRVLSACAEYAHPSPADEQLLRSAANDFKTSIDELACETIRHELQRSKGAD